MNSKSKIKNKKSKLIAFLNFLKKNYFILIFAACIGFVGIVASYKLFATKPTYIYAKVKVGQGMWWANTQKPSMWFIKAIQEAKEQKDLMGMPLVTMLNVAYYPSYLFYQYDVYVTVKLKVSSVGKKGTYSFNRETIGVSSPIDLEFSNVQFSGTVIALSSDPFTDNYTTKTIYLTKRIPFPWEYEQLIVGDKQTVGNRVVFTILEKYIGEISETTFLQQGTLINSPAYSYTVKANILVSKENNQYVFGEEYTLAPGKILQGVGTDNFIFTDYYIVKIE